MPISPEGVPDECPRNEVKWLFRRWGNQENWEHGFAQGKREAVLVSGRNCFTYGGQRLLPKRAEPRAGRPAATTPPKSAPTPLGVIFWGGCLGVGVSRGEGDGGGCWLSLCCAPYLLHWLLTRHSNVQCFTELCWALFAW